MVPEIVVKGLNSTAVKVMWSYSNMYNVKQFLVVLKKIPEGIVVHSEETSEDTREVTFTGLGKCCVPLLHDLEKAHHFLWKK